MYTRKELMRSLGRGQSREERGHRLEGHNCWMTPGLSLVNQSLSVLLWKSKAQTGKVNTAWKEELTHDPGCGTDP